MLTKDFPQVNIQKYKQRLVHLRKQQPAESKVANGDCTFEEMFDEGNQSNELIQEGDHESLNLSEGDFDTSFHK